MSSMLWRAVSESAVSGLVRQAVDRPRTPVRPGDLSPGNADDVSSPERENNLSNQARARALVHAGSAHCRSRPGDREPTRQGPRSHIQMLSQGVRMS